MDNDKFNTDLFIHGVHNDANCIKMNFNYRVYWRSWMDLLKDQKKIEKKYIFIYKYKYLYIYFSKER